MSLALALSVRSLLSVMMAALMSRRVSGSDVSFVAGGRLTI